MTKTAPITENRTFRRLYVKGKRNVFSLFVLYASENRKDGNGLGITVSKKLGTAVSRNRAKRIVREAYRELEPRIKTGWNFVFVARSASVFAKSGEVREEMEEAFHKLGIFSE